MADRTEDAKMTTGLFLAGSALSFSGAWIEWGLGAAVLTLGSTFLLLGTLIILEEAIRCRL